MAASYTSNILYHFVGFRHSGDHEANYALLLKILNEGFIRHRTSQWGEGSVEYNWSPGLEEGELLIPQVTCYCDIPYEGLNLHVKKYGEFGVGFSRQFMISSRARPVTYFPSPVGAKDENSGRLLFRKWLEMRSGFYDLLVFPNSGNGVPRCLFKVPENELEAIYAADDLLTEFFSFFKPFNSDLTDDGPDNFYMEREWRKRGHLRFQDDDVVEVIVHRSYLGRFASDVPKLSSKVKYAPE